MLIVDQLKLWGEIAHGRHFLENRLIPYSAITDSNLTEIYGGILGREQSSGDVRLEIRAFPFVNVAKGVEILVEPYDESSSVALAHQVEWSGS